MNSTLRALNGFGLGARTGEQRRIGDPRGWLRAQLQGDAPLLRAPAEGTPDAIADAVRAFRQIGQVGLTTRAEPEERRQARQQARRALVAIAAAESRAALTERVTTERPFVERLVAFWSNHLCVSVGAKLLVAPLAGSYERDAIRPHVLGRFEDMVLASAKHPAMLVYLDNFQSIGPNSRGAQAAPDGAGGQQARAERELRARAARAAHAGRRWRLHAAGRAGAREDPHRLDRDGLGACAATRCQAVGQQTRRLAADSAQAAQTASRTAHRLRVPGAAARAGSEDPARRALRRGRRSRRRARDPRAVPASVDRDVSSRRSWSRISSPTSRRQRRSSASPRRLRESDGDLRAVAGALIDLPEAWSDDPRKFRTPQDWLVAVLRAFDAPTQARRRRCRCCGSSAIRSGRRRRRRASATPRRSGPTPTRC